MKKVPANADHHAGPAFRYNRASTTDLVQISPKKVTEAFMAAADDRMPSQPDSVRDAKAVAFYSAAVQAWVTTRMEKDRALLNLAAGGIGLLVTLLTTVGPSSRSEFWLICGRRHLLRGYYPSCTAGVRAQQSSLERRYPEREDQRRLPTGRPRPASIRVILGWCLLTCVLGVVAGYNTFRDLRNDSGRSQDQRAYNDADLRHDRGTKERRWDQ